MVDRIKRTILLGLTIQFFNVKGEKRGAPGQLSRPSVGPWFRPQSWDWASQAWAQHSGEAASPSSSTPPPALQLSPSLSNKQKSTLPQSKVKEVKGHMQTVAPREGGLLQLKEQSLTVWGHRQTHQLAALEFMLNSPHFCFLPLRIRIPNSASSLRGRNKLGVGTGKAAQPQWAAEHPGEWSPQSLLRPQPWGHRSRAPCSAASSHLPTNKSSFSHDKIR